MVGMTWQLTWERQTVAMDYGHFLLVGGPSEHADDYAPLLDSATDGDASGIAGDGRMLVVISPHQNNFELELDVEIWELEPVDDVDDWQQVVRSWLAVDEDAFGYESPTLPFVRFEVPAGRYAVEVAGRGFVARGWPGSTAPGDVWRVRLWPAKDPTPTYVRRTWSPGPPAPEPVPGPAEVRERERAFESSWLSSLDPAVRAVLPQHGVTLADVQAAMAQVYGWDDEQIARAREALDALTAGTSEPASGPTAHQELGISAGEASRAGAIVPSEVAASDDQNEPVTDLATDEARQEAVRRSMQPFATRELRPPYQGG